MTDFKTIPLSEIHPDKNQPRKFFNESALKELTESVKSKGVLQPIMVRPNGKGFILVCGERRLKASIAAGLKDVPAVVRNLTDEEAMEIQFIENIQREDVHPMDEASTFKAMIENKIHPYTIADIAAKINKPEKYVVHRLSLNNLIPELQQEFWKEKFLIGHAVLFSKLSAEDQKLCMKECKDHWSDGDKNQFKRIDEVKGFISRNILRVLSSAPFKKDDATLNPEMGPCTTCPFRSGNNPTLFDEVKETDRCFKPACFENKIEVHLIRTIKTILEEEPATMFLKESYGRPAKPEILKLLKDFKVEPLDSYRDYSTYISKGDTKVKGIYISGDKAGQIQYVALNKKSKANVSKTSDGKPSNSSIDMEIAGIKQRTQRAAELDEEKVYAKVLTAMQEHETQKIIPNSISLVRTPEWVAMLFIVFDKAGYSLRDDFKKSLPIKGTPEQVYKSLSILTNEQITYMIRRVMLTNYGGNYPKNDEAFIIRKMAESYGDIPLVEYELEQKEKRIKREERAAQRIKALQDQKKEKPVKAPAAEVKQKSKSKTTKKKI